MKRLLAILAFGISCIPAQAQQTKAQLNTEINTNFPDNTSGLITPQALRTTTSDIVNSIMPTAPVTTGTIVCYDGVTGLLNNCNSSLTGTVAIGTGGSGPSFTATPTLGASGTGGSLTFGNATSGLLTLQTVAGALGTVTASFPANTGTVAETNLVQTFTANQTFGAQAIYTG